MGYADRSIEEFLDAVASERVTPAGGSAAAVVGATGAALCEMVCIHTLRSAADQEPDESSDVAALRDEFRDTRGHLLDLADADAEAVDTLLSAGGEGGTATNDAKRATGVPLTVAKACVAVVEGATVVVADGTPSAVPDAVTGAELAHAALQASLYTVRVNLNGIDDDSFVDDIERRAADLERNADGAYEQVMTLAPATHG